MKNIKRAVGIMTALFGFYACSGIKDYKHITIYQNDFSLQLPMGFDSMSIPENNQFSQARVNLGQRMFFDKSLSIDSSISCATCHVPEKYFTDGHMKSIGIDSQIIMRNSPSLFNVGYQPYFLREGGVPTLEMQILVPIQEHKEFNFNIVDLAERLRTDSSYVLEAKRAYNRKIDPFVITRAISCYERTLISGNSPFDRYQFLGDKKAISKDAKAGYALFNSNRLKCAECHSGVLFTNNALVSNALYEVYEDSGRARLTRKVEDRGVFKVPSLRNVAMTGPYMHDGSLQTLEEVIDHYAKGGERHENKSKFITGFTISELEKRQIIAFLESLTQDNRQSNFSN